MTGLIKNKLKYGSLSLFIILFVNAFTNYSIASQIPIFTDIALPSLVEAERALHQIFHPNIFEQFIEWLLEHSSEDYWRGYWNFHVRNVSLRDQTTFRHHIILSITVCGRFLERGVPHSLASQGDFAYDGKSFIYLDSSDRLAAIQRLLQEEQVTLERLDSRNLASFLVNKLIAKRYGVILPPTIYTGKTQQTWVYLRPNEMSYNPAWAEGISSPIMCKIKPVQMSGDHTNGWILRFSAVCDDQLVNYAVSITPTFQFKINEEVLIPSV